LRVAWIRRVLRKVIMGDMTGALQVMVAAMAVVRETVRGVIITGAE